MIETTHTNLVIFDCDGVLVESEAVHISAEMAFLAQAGLVFEREDYIRRFMGLPPDAWEDELGEVLTEKLGTQSIRDFFDRLDDFTMQKLKEELVPVEGAREAIQPLGMAKCVASSSPSESIQWKLGHTGLIDLFEPHLFSTQLVKNGKPAPDLFLLASERMGIRPSECVVIEDSSNGIIAAKRAGMKAVGFTAGGHCPDNHGATLLRDGADVIVDSYDMLSDGIDQLNRG